ncbi:MAG TPA: acetyl-CoA C-acyltransferase, partial [Sporolactobacillaceae bacterium]|nr:acetyl-CoA C-acyltransferase [Sporolactobacillaceae bacterium]
MVKVSILDGARTPFGSMGGSLKDISSIELGKIAAVEALGRSGVNASDIDNVVFGSVIHSDTNAAYLARHIALKSGVSEHVPALTVNRLCGSGLQAVVSGAQSMLLGEARVSLVGG